MANGLNCTAPSMASCAPQKQRHLSAIESYTTELVSYARKVEQGIEERYRELTGEATLNDQTTTETNGTFQAIRADLSAVRAILENIEQKFGSL